MVRTNLQEFVGDVHVLSNLQVGSNLFANDLAANVLTIDGSIGSTFFIGDGGLLSNIATTLNDIVANPGGNTVSNTLVFESGADATSNTAIATLSNVGISISNTEPTGEFQFAVGSNIFVNTHASNVLTVVGAIGSDLFIGDGGLLSNIATTIDQIIDQGNIVSNTLIFESGIDATSNTGIVTKKDVGISVSNTEPTGEFQFGVGSNLLVNVYSSNVLAIEGNVSAEKMTLGTITVTSAYGLNHVTAQGSVTSDTISLTNATTGLAVTSNATVGGNVTAETVITSANVEVGDRLKFASNVFVDDLRVADVAANLVTYDKTTGELMDSGGLFANKLAVVSVQPPSALSANTTTITKHGTYTVTTSGLESTSNTWNAFDGNSSVEWKSIFVGGRLYNAADTDGVYGGTSNLFTGNYIQPGVSSAGEWLAIEFPYKTTLRHMKLTPPATINQYPASANVYATNDSLTWTELTNWSGVNPVTSSNVQTVVVNATESFKKYAMVVTKANGGTDNVALAEWKLFTESFSIDGGKVEMASSAVMGGETTMDQHGPHGRGAAKMKKFPEIIFEEGKFDRNDTTNTYTQAGYTVTASSQANDAKNTATLYDDKFPDINSSSKGWQGLNGTYDSSGDATSIDTLTGITGATSTRNGSYTTIELPHKIKVSRIQLHTRNSTDHSNPGHPKQIYVYGSNDGSSWTQIGSHLFTAPPSSPIWQKIDINSTTPYNYFALQATSILDTTGRISLLDLEWYGYEEDPPAGDTSVDTTFTSIMNTPQTTGANVYVDAKLSTDFTNRVTGPDATGTATSYDSTGKYWELTGALESNVTLEANTFLSGDQPHAVSVWFNSSNLEANVSNTCVFSVSDQEHLNSENLDLQSNTWHNLTYAYQGEGGSRVTYLDGRKVAEDQAEDTFGDYPPFAMTGYSQGGYVVSASGFNAPHYPPWEAFDDDITDLNNVWHTPGADYSGTDQVYNGSDNFQLSSNTDFGHWIKIEMPHKLVVSHLGLRARIGGYESQAPEDFQICGSNDDVNWDILADINGASPQDDGSSYYVVNSNKGYRYHAIVCSKSVDATVVVIQNLKFYGHRENDLVRLPDPTNVLKYPHIAMTGPAQRGYVVSATAESSDGTYDSWEAFDGVKTGASTNVSAWMPNYDLGGDFGTNGVATTQTQFNPGGGAALVNGPALIIQFPYKVIVSSYHVYARAADDVVYPYANKPKSGRIYGSDDGLTWTQVDSFGDWTTWVANTPQTEVITTPGAYNRYAMVVESMTYQSQTWVAIGEWELYGTGVDSIPIQIGGGNIDKVANFRVYDKFVGEDQALEIWDAQKDLFREVKNSMTLHKGRLGLGTTEPEGRLAVLDEPNTFEPRWPPKPLVGYKTHIEGYGEFVVHRSPNESTGQYRGNSWWIFDDNQNVFNNTYHGERDVNDPINGNYSYFKGTNGEYSGNNSIGGFAGDWTVLESPKPIKINDIIRMRVRSASQSTRGFIIAAANKFDGVWTKLTEQSNLVWQTGGVGESKTFSFANDNYYKYYAIIITQAPAQYGYPTLSNMEFSGIVQQGQSVLHDGQLTLTKSLTVPRIGPALDADDTPRRDRLVVEYNTSTNPTFEGAVRDTSGRGNDGVFYGGASYDATEKALVFDGTDDSIQATTNLGSGDRNVSVSVWLNLHTMSSTMTPFLIGVDSGQGGLGVDFNINGSSLVWFTTNGSAISLSNWNTYVPLNTWTHLIFEHNTGGLKKLYINGISRGTFTSSTNLSLGSNPTLYIGNRISTNYFNGSISNFKLYDTALTAEEVKTLYDMGRCDEGHHVVNFSKTRVGIGLGDGEAPRGALDVRGDIYGGCPAFFNAYRDAGNTSGAVNPITWNQVTVNKGGGYDKTTGKFTASVSGYYRFDVYLSVENPGGEILLQWQKNDVDLTQKMYGWANIANHLNVAGNITIYLLSGDTFHVRQVSGAMAADNNANGQSYTNGFSGFYLSS